MADTKISALTARTSLAGTDEFLNLAGGVNYRSPLSSLSTLLAPGDVTGPSSATDNAIARYDATTGKLLQNSTAVLADNGVLSTAGITIGTSYASDATIRLYGGGSTFPASTVLRVEQASDTAAGPEIQILKARSGNAQTGDSLGQIRWGGWGGSIYNFGAMIQGTVRDSAPDEGEMGSSLDFFACPTGEHDPAVFQAMRLDYGSLTLTKPGVNSIHTGANTNSLTLSGGNDAGEEPYSAGSYLVMYGDSHASHPGDINISAGTAGTVNITGKTKMSASTTAGASLNIASGTAPTTPANGDIWFDGSALKIRIGGTTKTFTVT
jgi:hypothetical protein